MMDDATRECLLHPKRGDKFTEKGRVYYYILRVSWFKVWIMRAIAPCSVPTDGTIEKLSKKEFHRRFVLEDHFLKLVDRGNNVDGWL